MMYVVGVVKTSKRLAFCPSLISAERYIETLPNYWTGVYYIDGPCRDPIVVAVPTQAEIQESKQ